MRLHGTKTLYSGAYSELALDRWAERIQAWSDGHEPDDAKRLAGKPRQRAARDVFCYFDNDQKVEAPFDARRLKERLGAPAELPSIAALPPAHRRPPVRAKAATSKTT
jgi:uncharacterized protein YecE (DUF72 family)